MGGGRRNYMSDKRMIAGKLLRERKKREMLKNVKEEGIQKKADQEDIKRLLDMWKESKKKDESKE
jgi:hypothetical protein